MPITTAQKAAADAQQAAAAQDSAPQIRLLAGPGTGKTGTIIKRVLHLLSQGVNPAEIFVITFTRAACQELRERIQQACSPTAHPLAASRLQISTMHSLALRIASQAQLTRVGAHPPRILDNWEQSELYEKELATTLGCPLKRAQEIRLAYDAQWQTLAATPVAPTPITHQEMVAFQAFHAVRTNLYCSLLPGEVVHRCVHAFQMGQITASSLPAMQHLIVDEYQDLNACDQEFIRLLQGPNVTLFVAGDDDQSIYSFRYANPDGIVQFPTIYPSSHTHALTDCFRCTPAVLNPALSLIAWNPSRVAKTLTPLYGTATPPVQGTLSVWSFATQIEEAQAIAASCRDLVAGGMAGQEDEIVILLSNRALQLDLVTQELGNLGIQFSTPNTGGLTDDKGIRAAYALLRLAADNINAAPDYPAHRTLLECLVGVGQATISDVTEGCVRNGQNFRAIFYLPSPPTWLSSRSSNAVTRVTSAIASLSGWAMTDDLATRGADIDAILLSSVFQGASGQSQLAEWKALVASFQPSMNLQEVLDYLSSDSDTGQQAVLLAVNQRLGLSPAPSAGGGATGSVPSTQPKKVRILTMHGAKGLSGKVVFIPTVSQDVLPSQRDLQATGRVIEKRRLFYVSLTRAKAACIVSHVARFTQPQAFQVSGTATARTSRSQFLNEMGVASTTRSGGLTPAEINQIIRDINNL